MIFACSYSQIIELQATVHASDTADEEISEFSFFLADIKDSGAGSYRTSIACLNSYMMKLISEKGGKTILHLLRSSSTSMNSGFVTWSRILAVLKIISSKMNAAKRISSSFWSSTENVPSLDQMLWIEVLSCCFASLMAKLMVGSIITPVDPVVSAIKAKEIKSAKLKLYQAKGLTLSGIRTLY